MNDRYNQDGLQYPQNYPQDNNYLPDQGYDYSLVNQDQTQMGYGYDMGYDANTYNNQYYDYQNQIYDPNAIYQNELTYAQVPVVNETPTQIEVATPKKASSNLDKDNSKWIFPKNFKKLTHEEFLKLSPQKQKEYNAKKSGVKKIGYLMEKKSLNKFYRVSILDFLPLFIGQFISLIKFIIGYADIKQSINFDKRVVWDFKSNFVIGMVFALLIWPLIILSFSIIYPYIVLDSTTVTRAWTNLFDELNVSGIAGLGTGLQTYFDNAIVPLFSDSLLIFTLIIFLVVSMINVQSFLFSGLLNINRKNAFKMQRETVRDEIAKMKAQKKQ